MESGLKYPTFNIRIKHEGKRALVFDEIRKKWVALNPEEWVRQHFINYLVTEKKVPKSLISVEKKINLNGTIKRYDLIIYNTVLIPTVLIECKAPNVLLNEQVAEQILRYNLSMGVKYLLITNGFQEVIFQVSDSKTSIIEELPDFRELS